MIVCVCVCVTIAERSAILYSATCSCSVELYKLWNTLADFLPNWNFRGVFSIHINYNAVRVSEAATGGAGIRRIRRDKKRRIRREEKSP